MPDIVALIARALPLRSAIFLLEREDGPETILWQAKFPSGVVVSSASTYASNGLAGFRASTG